MANWLGVKCTIDNFVQAFHIHQRLVACEENTKKIKQKSSEYKFIFLLHIWKDRSWEPMQ